MDDGAFFILMALKDKRAVEWRWLASQARFRPLSAREEFIMEKLALTVGCDSRRSSMMERLCLDYGVSVCTVKDTAGAVEELGKNKAYLLVILFLDSPDILESIKVIRVLTRVPVLVLRSQYNTMEKIASLHAGADEYLQWTDRCEDEIASALALVRRYMGWNQRGEVSSGLSYAGLFISPRYRKILINLQEIHFPRKEFDLFYLLASQPGRVFTSEQLYENVWGDESDSAFENSLNSCLRRIRRKLDQIPDAPCRIENRWGVGYCFVHEKAKRIPKAAR